MMLQDVLRTRRSNLINIYCTAGFPGLNDLPRIMEALHSAGVDMVEIGIPYSDPLSDGPTIQESNRIALENGVSLEVIFRQLKTNPVPIAKIMMGYFNSVYQFGVERFCENCLESGVSGVILPDLPIDLYLESYNRLFDDHGLSNIFLITPETTEERLRYIDRHSSSFIYAVSQSGTTGKNYAIQQAHPYLKKLQGLNLSHPVLVGFGISSPQDLAASAAYANGVIVGSAFIRHLKNSQNVSKDTGEFVRYITQRGSL